MTIDEAINNLELIKTAIEWEYPLDYQVALDMAIDALKGSLIPAMIIDYNKLDEMTKQALKGAQKRNEQG